MTAEFTVLGISRLDDHVRKARPLAMPALDLWYSLERIELKLSLAGSAEEVG